SGQTSVVEIKFNDARAVRLRSREFDGLAVASARRAREILSTLTSGIERQFTQPESALDDMKRRNGGKGPELNNCYRVQTNRPAELIAAFQQLPEIEYAELAPTPEPAPGATPDFIGLQAYLLSAPGGIDADYAASIAAGEGVRIIDVEYSWNLAHEDLG